MDKIIPISDLQSKAKHYVDQVKKTDQPVVITQRGRASAILMNYDQYEGYLATLEEMSHPDWKERLERAQRDSRLGRGIELEKYAAQRAKKHRHAA